MDGVRKRERRPQQRETMRERKNRCGRKRKDRQKERQTVVGAKEAIRLNLVPKPADL